MVDILIIGAGDAGLTSAIEAKERGFNVVVATKIPQHNSKV
jgi:succinate dehydrogenase/fumarate reductase flavoprotein subunit